MKTIKRVTYVRYLLVIFSIICSVGLASPVVDNNAGTWTDDYNDSLGVASFTNAAVDVLAGVVKLESGQTNGSYRTTLIAPNSFSEWGRLTLDASYSAAADVQIEILDPNDSDNVILGPVDYHPGPVDLSGLSAATYPELRVRVTLAEGATRPTVSQLRATWTPRSILLMNMTAPATVPAGENLSCRVRYSCAYVSASDLVAWVPLQAMSYPANYGQDDNATFVSASNGGKFTNAAVTVKGVNIPANSIYWDLGEVDQGSSGILVYTLETKNGTLNGSMQSNRAYMVAANANAVTSTIVQTTIQSTPYPKATKDGAGGFYYFFDRFNTGEGYRNRFEVNASNIWAEAGCESLYNTVLFDNLNDMTGKIEPDYSGTVGIPVTNIAPSGGQYTAVDIVVDGVNVPSNSVYWQVGTLNPGDSFSGYYSVKLLPEPPLAPTGSYTSVCTVDSDRTDPVNGDFIAHWISWGDAIFYTVAGDGVGGRYRINVWPNNELENDFANPSLSNPYLYVEPGGVAPYGVRMINSGLMTLNDAVLFAKIPSNTTFKSAWYNDAWLKTNAAIFYSTTDTADWDTTPDYEVTNAPADFDLVGNTHWENYTNNPPADPSTVKWLAFWTPAINSPFLETNATCWVDGAPTRPYCYYDLFVDTNYLGAAVCEDQFVTNRGLMKVHAKTLLEESVPQVIDPPNDDVSDLERIRISVDKPILDDSIQSHVFPTALDVPGSLSFVVTNKNIGNAIAKNVQVELTWPRVLINGVMQYVTFAGVDKPIASFSPASGRVTVDLGNVAPDATETVTLTVNVPSGIDFGQELLFSARTSCDPDPCPVEDVLSTARAASLFVPDLRIHKNDLVDMVNSGGELEYELTVQNSGDAPGYNVWVVDRVPDRTVFQEATGPQGEQVWFSQVEDLPPSEITPLTPINAATIAMRFSPGNLNDGGTPGDPSDDIWTSPFGDQTRWVAWLMDDTATTPASFPVGATRTVGLTVMNDDDGPGPGTAGSAERSQIFNSAAVFSDVLLQAIGNETVSTVMNSPGVIVQKTGPSAVVAGQQFEWVIDYYNNADDDDDLAVITDVLPAGVTFISATHEWNAVALAHGAPMNNSGRPVPSATFPLGGGRTGVEFEIANVNNPNGYRGPFMPLLSQEGGTITLQVQMDPSAVSGDIYNNEVEGLATNEFGEFVSRDEHPVQVQNADVRMTKVSQPPAPIAGDTVTYTLIVANDGQVPATNVVIQDTVPVGLTYTADTTLMLSPNYSLAEPSVSGQTLTWSIANANAITNSGLAAGTLPAQSGDIFIQYQLTVDAGVSAGTSLTNDVVVGTDTPEDDVANNQDDAFVRTPYPDPEIEKSGPNSSVEPEERFTWNLSYWNNTRQEAANVYVIDTLPDYDGDAEADVTFVSQTAEGPGVVTAYYSDEPSDTQPAFDPLDPTGSGDWSAAPPAIVNHIAWLIGTLPGESDLYSIDVSVDAVQPNGGSPVKLPSGVNLTNVASIATTDTDDDTTNNEDDHVARTPGSDVELVKTGSSEGSYPGVTPGDTLTYTLEVINSGNQEAYGIEVIDTLAAELTTKSPAHSLTKLTLVDENGDSVNPVDEVGDPITGDIPVTFSAAGNQLTWYFGSSNAADPLYYRNVALLPGQRQFIKIYATVNQDVSNGTVISNSAQVVLHNLNDGVAAEQYLVNNHDDTWTIAYRPDLAVRKSVVDQSIDDADWTESGHVLEYTIEYQNMGFGPAVDSVISEIVPDGTTLLNVNVPDMGSLTYYPGPNAADATSFDIDLGTLIAPANMDSYSCFKTETICLANGSGNISNGMFSGRVGVTVESLGELDGAPAIVLGAYRHDSPTGGAHVIRLDTNGIALSCTRLVNGENGIPAGMFSGAAGRSISSLGELNGAPAFVVSMESYDSGDGGACVVRLNPDGSALSCTRLANGENGISAGMFSGHASYSAAFLGELDGAPAIVLGAYAHDSENGGAYVIRLDTDGSALSCTRLANGENGISAGMFSGRTGHYVESLGELDGAPAIVLGAYYHDSNNGGAYVIRLDTDGSALSCTKLANGDNGIPAGMFSGFVGISVDTLGELDGAPAIVLGAPGHDSGNGGAYVIRLDTDGSALSCTRLANAEKGIPSGMFGGNVGYSVESLGELYGAPAFVVGAHAHDSYNGGAHVIRLDTDGSALSCTRLANGENGIPSGMFDGRTGFSAEFLGELDGAPAIVLGAFYHDSENGGAYVIRLVPEPCDQDADFSFDLTGSNVTAKTLAYERLAGEALSTIRLVNGENGIPASTFAGEAGARIASINDLGGVPAIALSAHTLRVSEGGAYVVRLDTNGVALSVTVLTNGVNGIPPLMFEGHAGFQTVSLGDLNGAPAIVMGGHCIDGVRGGAYVVRLATNGTALSCIKLANGQNGISADTFAGYAGISIASIGELNGAPAIVLSAIYLDSNSGGAYVVRLNTDGSALSCTKLANGENGIDPGMFSGDAGWAVESLGDLDGAPAIVLGARDHDSGNGGAYVIRLDTDGSALSCTKLANGVNGIPAGMFSGYAGYSAASLGELNGAPAIVLGAYNHNSGNGGAYVIRLDTDGSALSCTRLANAENGIPSGMFDGRVGRSIASLGELNGAPAFVVGANFYDSGNGGAYVIRLDTDGSALSCTRLVNGENGIPAGMFDGQTGYCCISPGELNGAPAIVLGANGYDSQNGGAYVVRLSNDKLFDTGMLEVPLSANEGLLTWGRLFSASDVPDGTTLSYSIGRMVGGVPTYDLGAAYMNISGPLPADGFNIDALTNESLIVQVDFATTQPDGAAALTPTLNELYATYNSSEWPSFTFTVQVDDPVPAHVLPEINNTVSIDTPTPEIRYDNNSAGDDIAVILTDLEVVKSIDKSAALAGSTVVYTLHWANNGPQDAVDAVLYDTLPPGISYSAGTAVPPEDSLTGAGTEDDPNVMRWDLGSVLVGDSGTMTITGTVLATVGGNPTAGETLVNRAVISNSRQETTYDNNEDDVSLVVNELANAWVEKTGPDTAPLDGEATFTLSYGNNGNSNAASVVLTDTLPAGLSFDSAVPAWDGLAGQTATWNLGTLVSGATGSITIVADVGTNYATYHNRTLTNQTEISTTTSESSLDDNQAEHPVLLLGSPVSISGFVWNDYTKDAVWDAPEPGLEDVTITLAGTNVFGDSVSVTAVTDQDGAYSFVGLIPGTYTLTETQPVGYWSSVDELGTVYMPATENPPGSGRGTNTGTNDDVLASIALAPGERGIDYNFADYRLWPTRAEIALVSAEWVEDAGYVVFRTDSEWNTAGFDVYRVSGAKASVKLNNRLIAAGMDGRGGLYRIADPAAEEGGAGRYRIMERELTGTERDLGTHDVVFGPAVSMDMLQEEDVVEEVVHADLPPSDVLRVTVEREGLYGIALSDIAEGMGRDLTDIQVLASNAQLAVSCQGEPVAVHYEPFNQRLVFYGRPSTNWYMPGASYLVKEAAASLMSVRDPGASSGAEVFNTTLVFEEDRWTLNSARERPDDFYYWDYMISGHATLGTRSFKLDLRGYAGGDVQLRVSLQGWTSTTNDPDHAVEFKLNGNVIGDTQFDGQSAHDAILTVPGTAVLNGTNELSVTGISPAHIFSVVVVDRIEATFDRTLVPMGSRTVPVVAPQSGSISAADFADPIVVSLDTMEWIADEEGRCNTKAWTTTGEEFAVVDRAQLPVLTPEYAVDDAWFTAVGNAIDYLIVTPRALTNAVQELAEYRAGQGLRTGVAVYEDICDVMCDGLRTPEAIRELLKYARANWASAPWMVVLAGSGHFDYLGVQSAQVNHLPPLLLDTYDGLFASDSLIIDLDGDQKPNCSIGRLPARTGSELSSMITKIKTYEAQFGEGWQNKVLLVADAPDAAGDFPAVSDQIASLSDSAYVMELTDVISDGAAGTRQKLLAGFATDKAGIVHYTGHGGTMNLSSENLLHSADVSGMKNAGNPPIVIMLCCLAGRYEVPDSSCLAVDLVRKDQGGAVAVWSPTGMSMNDPASIMGQVFYENVMQDKSGTLGLSIFRAAQGDDAGFYEPDTFGIYNLLGDPALRFAGNVDGLADDEGYAQWRWQRFAPTDLAAENISGEEADADQNGFNNYVEYALGCDPTASDEVPVLTAIRQADENRAWAMFEWRQRRAIQNTEYRITVSSNLFDWTIPVNLHILSRSNMPDGVMEKIRARVPMDEKLYIKQDIIKKD